MFVGTYMTKNPLTIPEDMPVQEAEELMRKHKIRRLPVVKGDKLVGIVTEIDLLRVSPSSATSLSVFELNYLLSRLQVKDAMTKNPRTISPDATLEEAALIMRENNVGALPVVDNGKLVGIITESDIFDAFIDLMGLRQTGTRVVIDVENRLGVVADVTDVIKAHGVSIISLACHCRDDGTSGELVLRLDTQDPGKLLADLEKRGYRVVHVTAWS
ncbi:MAG: CBS domain-containing protein [Firmicutes bacterium]|jgi:acetoin utilization protein AcuB|nr:CBS domain-containing protein [Bacillota bacterium]